MAHELYQINSSFLIPRKCKNLSVSPKKSGGKMMPKIDHLDIDQIAFVFLAKGPKPITPGRGNN